MVLYLDEFEGQGHQGQKMAFLALSAACMQFIFGETSLASSFLLSYFSILCGKAGHPSTFSACTMNLAIISCVFNKFQNKNIVQILATCIFDNICATQMDGKVTEKQGYSTVHSDCLQVQDGHSAERSWQQHRNHGQRTAADCTCGHTRNDEAVDPEFWDCNTSCPTTAGTWMTPWTHRPGTTTPPQPFYGPFSGTTRVSRCQKRTYGLYGARED